MATQIYNSGIKLPILLHGVDKTAWDLLKIAIDKGYQTRIGFEDILTLPNSEKPMKKRNGQKPVANIIYRHTQNSNQPTISNYKDHEV